MVIVSTYIMKVKTNLPELEATKCRCRKTSVVRTCFASPRLFLAKGGRAADLQNRSRYACFDVAAPSGKELAGMSRAPPLSKGPGRSLKVYTGFPEARRLRARASVLLPGPECCPHEC